MVMTSNSRIGISSTNTLTEAANIHWQPSMGLDDSFVLRNLAEGLGTVLAVLLSAGFISTGVRSSVA